MPHCLVPAAEALMDKEIPVLDKGFVRLVDYMGGDERIVQAARVSYGAGTRTIREDTALIDYLLRNDHTSPFEQVVLTFHIKLPVFVARQWIRHRTARVNEVSGRYTMMKDEFYLPGEGDLAFQSRDNKQGRSEKTLPPEDAAAVRTGLRQEQEAAYRTYQDLLSRGLAREIARVNLPLSLYTEWYWQIDLHNLFRFLALRLDPHAQKEIRSYAAVLLDAARAVAPAATESFERNIRSGVRFSGPELTALRRLLRGEASGLEGRDAERLAEKLDTERH
ncbi:MAG TPA: FAD-dependent thymidylate synthase [Magnetospirillaceae bacterium]|nr:FAD-dependent thymidylate synthase [Magnetospirillaceae bacterium]